VWRAAEVVGVEIMQQLFVL